jgi:hypothetical protein
MRQEESEESEPLRNYIFSFLRSRGSLILANGNVREFCWDVIATGNMRAPRIAYGTPCQYSDCNILRERSALNVTSVDDTGLNGGERLSCGFPFSPEHEGGRRSLRRRFADNQHWTHCLS